MASSASSTSYDIVVDMADADDDIVEAEIVYEVEEAAPEDETTLIDQGAIPRRRQNIPAPAPPLRLSFPQPNPVPITVFGSAPPPPPPPAPQVILFPDAHIGQCCLYFTGLRNTLLPKVTLPVRHDDASNPAQVVRAMSESLEFAQQMFDHLLLYPPMRGMKGQAPDKLQAARILLTLDTSSMSAAIQRAVLHFAPLWYRADIATALAIVFKRSWTTTLFRVHDILQRRIIQRAGIAVSAAGPPKVRRGRPHKKEKRRLECSEDADFMNE